MAGKESSITGGEVTHRNAGKDSIFHSRGVDAVHRALAWAIGHPGNWILLAYHRTGTGTGEVPKCRAANRGRHSATGGNLCEPASLDSRVVPPERKPDKGAVFSIHRWIAVKKTLSRNPRSGLFR